MEQDYSVEADSHLTAHNSAPSMVPESPLLFRGAQNYRVPKTTGSPKLQVSKTTGCPYQIFATFIFYYL